MSQRNNRKVVFYACGAICAALAGVELRADDSPTTEQQLRLLQEQNHALQQQLQRQQELIESLSHKVNEIQDASVQRGRELERLQSEVKDVTPVSNVSKPVSFGQINISGEGGVAFFNSGSHGQFPNAEFRVDEAKLFVEAPIWKEVYFFSELNLATRENSAMAR